MSDPVNTSHIVWTIGQIAARDGISKPAVSKMVAKLVKDHGLPVTRDGRERVATVSVAHYDHLRATFGSSQQQMATQTSAAPEKKEDNSRDEALRQAAWIALDRSRLEIQERAGHLVRSDRLAEGIGEAGREIQAIMRRLPNRADELSLIVAREGTSGLRLMLKKIGTEICNEVANRLDSLAAGMPEHDLPLETEADGDRDGE